MQKHIITTKNILMAILIVSLVSCSNKKSDSIKRLKKLDDLYLEYVSTEGIQSKDSLIKSIYVIKNANPKYIRKFYMLSLTYARLYTLEVLYGDESKAQKYLKQAQHYNIVSQAKANRKKNVIDKDKLTGENCYKTIKRMDKKKKYPEWSQLKRKRGQVPATD